MNLKNKKYNQVIVPILVCIISIIIGIFSKNTFQTANVDLDVEPDKPLWRRHNFSFALWTFVHHYDLRFLQN